MVRGVNEIINFVLHTLNENEQFYECYKNSSISPFADLISESLDYSGFVHYGCDMACVWCILNIDSELFHI